MSGKVTWYLWHRQGYGAFGILGKVGKHAAARRKLGGGGGGPLGSRKGPDECVGKAVTPRRLCIMPRMVPKSPSSRAIPYICGRPSPRLAVNIYKARTTQRQVEC